MFNIVIKIAVIGLGYFGIHLARLIATKYLVVGFDINQTRFNVFLSGTDSTLNFIGDGSCLL